MKAAGFWRRAFASSVDGLCISLVLTVAAVILFPLTGGRYQDRPLIWANSCKGGTPRHEQLAPDLHANFEMRCDLTFFGLQTGRTMTLGHHTQNGATWRNIAITSAADEMGEPIFALHGSVLTTPLYLLMRGLCDIFGGTPGRILLGIRIACNPTSRRRQIVQRYAWFVAPLLPSWLLGSFSMLFPFIAGQNISQLFWLTVGTAVPGLVFCLWALVAVVRRRPTYYDKWAGTSVELAIAPAAEPAAA